MPNVHTENVIVYIKNMIKKAHKTPRIVDIQSG